MNRASSSVLVVDDDVDTCRNLSDILTDLGYDVDTAHDGPSALELVKRRGYDVALLDYKMPGMDGLTLYREIKRLRGGTVGIVVTAYAKGNAAEEAVEAGAWQVLSKPVDLGRLLPLVSEAVGQPLVLVVDDDHDLCANLSDLFRERGYRVCVAHDEQEVKQHIADTQFQAVLIDMKLQTGDGTGVFRIVRQANPRARTIMITGHRHEMDQQIDQLLRAGADAVCYKPFDVPQLLATLGQLTTTEPAGGVAAGGQE
jgi:CheY-like chemotaxis protein